MDRWIVLFCVFWLCLLFGICVWCCLWFNFISSQCFLCAISHFFSVSFCSLCQPSHTRSCFHSSSLPISSTPYNPSVSYNSPAEHCHFQSFFSISFCLLWPCIQLCKCWQSFDLVRIKFSSFHSKLLKFVCTLGSSHLIQPRTHGWFKYLLHP